MGGLCGKSGSRGKKSLKQEKKDTLAWQALYDIRMECCCVPTTKLLNRRTNGVQGCNEVVIVKISVAEENPKPKSVTVNSILRMPVIDWGELDVKLQFPQFLPMNIWPGELFLFALINPDTNIGHMTKVTLTGIVGGEHMCLEQYVKGTSSYDTTQWQDISETLEHLIRRYRAKATAAEQELANQQRPSSDTGYNTSQTTSLLQPGEIMYLNMGEAATPQTPNSPEPSLKLPHLRRDMSSVCSSVVEVENENGGDDAQRPIRVREYTMGSDTFEKRPDSRAVSPDWSNLTPNRQNSPIPSHRVRSKVSVHSLCDYVDALKSNRISSASLKSPKKDVIPAVDRPENEGSFSSLCTDIVERVTSMQSINSQSINSRNGAYLLDTLPPRRERAATAPSSNQTGELNSPTGNTVHRSPSENDAMTKRVGRKTPRRQTEVAETSAPTQMAADSTEKHPQSDRNRKRSTNADGKNIQGTKDDVNMDTQTDGDLAVFMESVDGTDGTEHPKHVMSPVMEGMDADDKYESESPASESTLEYRQKANSMSYTKRSSQREKIARATSLVQCSKIKAGTKETKVKEECTMEMTPPPFEAFSESPSPKPTQSVKFSHSVWHNGCETHMHN